MTKQIKSLNEITSNLGINHQVQKEAQKELKKSRDEFFETATATLAKSSLATKTISIPEGQDSIEWVRKWYPGWRITGINFPDQNQILIDEDPSLMKFVWANKEDGYFYQRTVSQASPSLDDEALEKEEPEVWKRNSKPDPVAEYWANYFLGLGSIFHKDLPQVIKPQEEWLTEDLDVISRYIIPGPISVTLQAPRKAKAGELKDE